MEQQNIAQASNNSDAAPCLNDHSISMFEIAGELWHRCWMVLGIILTVLLLATAHAVWRATYTSTAVFQIGGNMSLNALALPSLGWQQVKTQDAGHQPTMSAAELRERLNYLFSLKRFDAYVAERKLTGPAVARVREVIAEGSDLNAAIESYQASENANSRKDNLSMPIVGIKIRHAAPSPKLAQKTVQLLGDYAWDSILYSYYADWLNLRIGDLYTRKASSDVSVLQTRLRIRDTQRRLTDLERIASRHIESKRRGSEGSPSSAFVVSDGTARYLPITAQITGAEVEIAEANLAIHNHELEVQQIGLYLNFYRHARDLLNRRVSGVTFPNELQPLADNLFRGLNLEDDRVDQVYRAISLENQEAVNSFQHQSRYVTSPTLPIRSSVNKAAVVSLSLLVGLFLSGLVAWANLWMRKVKAARHLSA